MRHLIQSLPGRVRETTEIECLSLIHTVPRSRPGCITTPRHATGEPRGRRRVTACAATMIRKESEVWLELSTQQAIRKILVKLNLLSSLLIAHSTKDLFYPWGRHGEHFLPCRREGSWKDVGT